MLKKLVAGPVFSEFGWELMSFQALVRKAASAYDEVVICAREGHEAIYKDFMTSFIPHHIGGIKDIHGVTGVNFQEVNLLKTHIRTQGGDWIQPTGYIPISQQLFTPFGNKEHGKRLGYNFDLIVHARKPIGKRPGHSWPLQNWNSLMTKLDKYRVAAVGTEAYLPEGAVDMRAAGLQDVMDAMAAAKMVVGPSSGPMHLASLCRTNHLVWTDDKFYSAIGGNNRQRYEKLWNPFNTPCKVIDTLGWHPTADVIYEAIEECLQAWTKKTSKQ